MKGFRFPGNRQVLIADCPKPAPGPGEVLIRTKASAICGTDLHLYRQATELRRPAAHFCTGHEPVGEIAEIGPGVRNHNVGDRVVAYHVMGCGKCTACSIGAFKECPEFVKNAMAEGRDGSNAEYICVAAQQVLPLPDDFSFEEGAVLACNFGTAYGAVRNAFRFPGDTVAIWGMGPVGLCALLIAKALGMRVIAVDVTKGRLALAKSLGADEVLDGKQENLVQKIRALTADAGPASTIDTTGMPSVHGILVDTVATRGRVVLVGIGKDSAVGPILWTVLKQLTIVGSWIFDLADWPVMLNFVRHHRIDLMSVVSKVAAPDQAKEMYELADTAEGGKIVFRW